ncbi:MAG: TrkA C-terminal domain-containing protein [Candidatus Gygaella obscura]|nr:TrkA C-terminal domain-containing protein [Candidatus Gygaella obscura]
MIALFITIFIFILLAVVVEVATTALRMTGLDIRIARFQAMSALTGTGFTTRESELITDNKQRRIIVMSLMIIGPIGFVTILTSILLSAREHVMLYQLLVLAVLALLLLKFSKSRKLMSVFHKAIETTLKKRHYPRKIVLEEILQLDENFGVCEIKIDKHSKLADKTLAQSDIKEKGFIVLAIQREDNLITVPHANDKILVNDILVVFGNLKHLRDFAR